MRVPLLEAAIKAKGETLEDLAKTLSMTLEELEHKLKIGEEIGSKEIIKIRDKYHLSKEQVNKIFFD